MMLQNKKDKEEKRREVEFLEKVLPWHRQGGYYFFLTIIIDPRSRLYESR